MGQFDASLGAMLIATWINALLYMGEILQFIRVWRDYPNDPMFIKLAMIGALVADTACTCAACATVYLYCVTNWGNVAALALQYWTFPLYIITTTIAAAIVQSFLIFRFYSLSRHNKPLTLVFMLFALTAAGGGTYTMFTIFLFPSFAERSKNVVSASIWLVATTVTDISLALGIVWKLRSVKTSFRTTQTLLSKLSATALQSGAVTSLIATVVLTTFLQNNESNIPVAFNFFLGRVYSHTMLYSLSIRKSVRNGNGSSDVHTSGDQRDHSQPAISLNGIHIQRSVHIDDSNAPSPLKSAASQGYYTGSIGHNDHQYGDTKALSPDEAFVSSPRGNFVVME